ncbi:MAG: glycoside hydrolase family 2 [Tannerellaceae bacterium]|jgi:hypothetical protein|nr:glycoside hydrolase family 2 [Tannerellaceae bacterium]
MKYSFFCLKLVCLAAIMLLAASCEESGEQEPLKAQFITPPETIQTGCYWYWIDDHISKEGVVKDLQAMKKAGINSAFVGNIGDQGYAYGPARIFSDEWWDVIHTMFKTAGELGIEIGMFNCPGWSMTGGPWIKPDQSMRYIASSETRVSGPRPVKVVLPVPPAASHMKDWSGVFVDNEGKPSPHFQDVKVIAFPVPKDYREDLLEAPGVTSSVGKAVLEAPGQNIAPAGQPASSLAKTNPKSPIYQQHAIPAGTKYTISYKLPQPRNARSIFIYPAGRVNATASLEAKVNGAFVRVDTFPVKSDNPMPAIGFAPYSPIVSVFANTTSDEYRLTLYNINEPSALGKISLFPTIALESYAEKLLARMAGCNPAWTEYKWPQQADVTVGEGLPSTGQVIDITDKMSADGTLVWDAPEGEWLVLRTGMVPHEVLNSPSKADDQGFELDKLSAQHIPYHFDHFIGEVLRKIPAEDRPTFKIVVADSWEKGGTLFTDDFNEKMKARYGYDPMPFMPVHAGHVVGSPDMTDRYLWDARRLAADLMAEVFVPGLNESYHKNGLSSWMEDYGDWGFPGEFLYFGKYTDKVGGEFWTGSLDDRYVRVASSTAHIYNKKQVYAESFTGGWGFKHHPHSLKPFGDRAFAAGMNSCNLHVYIQQPYDTIAPGIDAWFGIEFNRKNTWFSQIDQFVTYLKRCGLMLQQGLNQADIAYFIGEDVPVNSGPFGLNKSLEKDGITIPELPQGYQFDYVNYDVILNDMQVKDGTLTLPHGTAYKILVLPPLETMRPELLQKIEQLVAGGAVVLGPAPKRSPSLQGYPEADKQVQELAAKIWSDASAKQNKYGKGLALNHITLAEALTLIGVKPDCHVPGLDSKKPAGTYQRTASDGDSDNFVYAHRTDGDKEIYFIANLKNEATNITPEFRVSGKQPEWWNPVTGEIRKLPAYEQREGVTAVPLQLEGNESAFIVFHKKGKPESFDLTANFPQTEELIDISASWTVTFDSDEVYRGPAEPVAFGKPEDWSQSDDERIRYYSGTAFYTRTFDFPAVIDGNKQFFVEFDKVRHMAKVKINGVYAGGTWTPPYRVDITKFVKDGQPNSIEVEVVNTWANRLIGDQFLPKEKRKVDSRNNPWRTTSERQPSGLIGSVKITTL